MGSSRIKGNWRAGWALDLHTTSSSINPDGSFTNTYTEIGEKLNQLKYRNNLSVIDSLAETASSFIKELLVYKYLAAIVPIPPSKLDRPYQPVFLLTEKIGELVNLPAPTDYLTKNKATQPLKEITDIDTRREQLSDAFSVRDNRFKGKYVMLFDDLYRSGETLNAASSALTESGGVSRVFVLTLTKTRVNR